MLDLFRGAGMQLLVSGHLHRTTEGTDAGLTSMVTGPVGRPLGGQSGFRAFVVTDDAITSRYYGLGEMPYRIGAAAARGQGPGRGAAPAATPAAAPAPRRPPRGFDRAAVAPATRPGRGGRARSRTTGPPARLPARSAVRCDRPEIRGQRRAWHVGADPRRVPRQRQPATSPNVAQYLSVTHGTSSGSRVIISSEKKTSASRAGSCRPSPSCRAYPRRAGPRTSEILVRIPRPPCP